MIFLKYLIIFLIFLLLADLFLIITPKSKLKIIPIKYKIQEKSNHLKVTTEFNIVNLSRNKETMIPNLYFDFDLFSDNYLAKEKYTKKIFIIDKENKQHEQDYWKTTIIKAKSFLKIQLVTTLDLNERNNLAKSLWLKIYMDNYGHFGQRKSESFFLIDIERRTDKLSEVKKISLNNNYEAIAIKTNLLGAFDDPANTIYKYCKGLVKREDILIIGETPLAIMQGRYIMPNNLDLTFFSKIFCYFFHPTSSLATASGMQLLINKIGITRIFCSLFIGIIFK